MTGSTPAAVLFSDVENLIVTATPEAMSLCIGPLEELAGIFRDDRQLAATSRKALHRVQRLVGNLRQFFSDLGMDDPSIGGTSYTPRGATADRPSDVLEHCRA